jgi:hypothetical protein
MMSDNNNDDANGNGSGRGGGRGGDDTSVTPTSTSTVPTPTQTLKLFTDILQMKAANINSKYAKERMEPEFKPERQMITQMNAAGVTWGLVTAGASLVGLRYVPDWLAKTYANKRKIKFVRPPRMFGAMGYAFGLLFDVTLSVMLGASTCMTCTDTEAVKAGLATIPLVEGRSVMSDELCTSYIRAYQLSQQKGFDWPKHTRTTHTSTKNPNNNIVAEGTAPSAFLRHLEIFVKNCQQRQQYEHELRRDQGLASDQPVVVPSPGVPVNADTSFEGEGIGAGTNTFEDFDTMTREQTTMDDLQGRGRDHGMTDYANVDGDGSSQQSSWVDAADDMSGTQAAQGQSKAYRGGSNNNIESAPSNKVDASEEWKSFHDFGDQNTKTDNNNTPAQTKQSSTTEVDQSKNKRRWWGGRS